MTLPHYATVASLPIAMSQCTLIVPISNYLVKSLPKNVSTTGATDKPKRGSEGEMVIFFLFFMYWNSKDGHRLFVAFRPVLSTKRCAFQPLHRRCAFTEARCWEKRGSFTFDVPNWGKYLMFFSFFSATVFATSRSAPRITSILSVLCNCRFVL